MYLLWRIAISFVVLEEPDLTHSSAEATGRDHRRDLSLFIWVLKYIKLVILFPIFTRGHSVF
jgi:hypothetical protein